MPEGDERERLVAALKRDFQRMLSRAPAAPFPGCEASIQPRALCADAGEPLPSLLDGMPQSKPGASLDRPLASTAERPISFSPPLLQAILDGRKTQTRRPIRPAPARLVDGRPVGFDGVVIPCPWDVGDVLWVREAWATVEREGGRRFAYARDESASRSRTRWSTSRFMPREAARVFLRVTGVSAQRLSVIDEADAIAEGFEPMPLGSITARDVFLGAWDSFYGDGEFAAVHDPLVWRIEFKLERAAAKNARRV